ncbi:MAG: hypothetical protein ABI596_15675, partial [Pyrinomonadaceae bacterium]
WRGIGEDPDFPYTISYLIWHQGIKVVTPRVGVPDEVSRKDAKKRKAEGAKGWAFFFATYGYFLAALRETSIN